MELDYLKNSLKLGVVGSRGVTDSAIPFIKDAIIDFIISKNLDKNGTKNIIIVSGGARGVDSYAEIIASHMQWDKLIFNAKRKNKDGSPNKGTGFEKNSSIIDYSDAVIAFHREGSNGTQDSINKAKANKKILRVISL